MAKGDRWFRCRDQRCTRARASVCRCSCGGLFHGQDLANEYTEVDQRKLQFRVIDRTTGEVFESTKVYESLDDLLLAARWALIWALEHSQPRLVNQSQN